MHYEPDVAVDANRPEVLVFRFIELVELEARMGRFNCRSNAVVLTAFCSSDVSRARLAVKVSEIRNSIAAAP
jgi:hypothetical protein